MPNEDEDDTKVVPSPPSERGGGEISVPAEETRPRRDIPRPAPPSQEEIDKHKVDHLPYRNWCPDCVEGFGRERAHRAREGADRDIPLVVCDYLFITPTGVFDRSELPVGEREAACKVLVVKCVSTKCLFAHAVSQKGVGPDGFVIDRLKEDIVWLGHASVVIRRDNEPALARVVDKAIKVLKASEGVTAT